jgi:hypothetical protein
MNSLPGQLTSPKKLFYIYKLMCMNLYMLVPKCANSHYLEFCDILRNVHSHCRYWHHLRQYQQWTMSILVLDQSAEMPIPARAPFNAHTGDVPCRYWYCTKMHKCQYRYWHHRMPVPVMYHANTGIGPKCKYANTGTGTI